MSVEFTDKVIAEKYRVEQKVGTSGLGLLYRGRNLLIEKPVSLVLLPTELAVDESIKRRFFSEAKIAAKISHPNILNLLDFGIDSNRISYAVYERANGETLAEALKREGRLPVNMAVDVAGQISSALSSVHSGGLIHGSLTTENVLVAGGDEGNISVKVFDFGTPNAINDDGRQHDATRFAYIAPEQCAGSDTPDERGDVYSLGVILFEMLAGSQPFTGTTPTDVMMRQIEEPPPPLSAFRQDLPPAIEPVVLKALSKNPEMRHQTAAEFQEELSQAGITHPAAAAATAESGNNIWKTAFIVLVGVSVMTIGLIYATSVKQTDPSTALQPDANAMPVQPINPATGTEEQNLSMMQGIMPEFAGNSNISVPPGTLPGGDGYDAWANGGRPPAGAPGYVPPAGQLVTIDPNNPSQFNQDAGCILQPSGILLCPVQQPPTPKPSPTPKTAPVANVNVSATPATNPTPRTTPAPTRTSATPDKPANNTKP